jgi:hypothetical protein
MAQLLDLVNVHPDGKLVFARQMAEEQEREERH